MQSPLQLVNIWNKTYNMRKDSSTQFHPDKQPPVYETKRVLRSASQGETHF
jgi:hypothetical protein